jgi:hypothetical protein
LRQLAPPHPVLRNSGGIPRQPPSPAPNPAPNPAPGRVTAQESPPIGLFIHRPRYHWLIASHSLQELLWILPRGRGRRRGGASRGRGYQKAGATFRPAHSSRLGCLSVASAKAPAPHRRLADPRRSVAPTDLREQVSERCPPHLTPAPPSFFPWLSCLSFPVSVAVWLYGLGRGDTDRALPTPLPWGCALGPVPPPWGL